MKALLKTYRPLPLFVSLTMLSCTLGNMYYYGSSDDVVCAFTSVEPSRYNSDIPRDWPENAWFLYGLIRLHNTNDAYAYFDLNKSHVYIRGNRSSATCVDTIASYISSYLKVPPHSRRAIHVYWVFTVPVTDKDIATASVTNGPLSCEVKPPLLDGGRGRLLELGPE